MNNITKDYHHFKGNRLTGPEKVQRQVTRMILDSKIPDKSRENSVIWELKHSSGVVTVGRILAIKRELDIRICETICILHDIYAIVEGKYNNHAVKGAKIAEKILFRSKAFSKKEINIISEAIACHSDKHLHSDKPYVEMIKDADVFECSLYQGAEGFYRLHKPAEIFLEYKKRIIYVRRELGLPPDPIFR